MRIRDNLDKKRKISPLIQAKNAVIVQSDKLNIKGMLIKCLKLSKEELKKNMGTEMNSQKNKPIRNFKIF